MSFRFAIECLCKNLATRLYCSAHVKQNQRFWLPWTTSKGYLA